MGKLPDSDLLAKDVTDAIPYSIGSLVKDHADEKTAMRALQNI